MKGSVHINGISQSENIGYSPKQIFTAYNLTTGRGGRGIKVAIIDFFKNPYIVSNLDKFSEKFGLPPASVQFYGEGSRDAFDFSAFIEASADTQWVHGISPYSQLIVVTAPSYNVRGAVSAVEMAKKLDADIILMTFQANFETEYVQYQDVFSGNHIFIASAGDTGANASFPACYPSCIAVGGTSLEISNEGERMSDETVWQGTGGGICGAFDIPDYQRRMDGISELTGGKRGVPDISFLADPQYGVSVYHSSVNDTFGWYKVGGTSISASIVAGILANVLSFAQTQREDYPNILREIYSLAGDYAYLNTFAKFYDVTEGNNGEFSASPGYDLCTGLGSFINL